MSRRRDRFMSYRARQLVFNIFDLRVNRQYSGGAFARACRDESDFLHLEIK